MSLSFTVVIINSDLKLRYIYCLFGTYFTWCKHVLSYYIIQNNMLRKTILCLFSGTLTTGFNILENVKIWRVS